MEDRRNKNPFMPLDWRSLDFVKSLWNCIFGGQYVSLSTFATIERLGWLLPSRREVLMPRSQRRMRLQIAMSESLVHRRLKSRRNEHGQMNMYPFKWLKMASL